MSFLGKFFTRKPVQKKIIGTLDFDNTKLNFDKINTAQKMVDTAYDLNLNLKGGKLFTKKKLETIKELEKDGWNLVHTSKYDVNESGFKAAVYIKGKEVFFAIAGTSPNDKNDISDDLYIAGGAFPPSKIKQLYAIVDHVIKEIKDSGGNPSEYKFNTAGHSLGSLVADMTALVIKAKGLNLGNTITFDSPGSYNSLKTAIDSGNIANAKISTTEGKEEFSDFTFVNKKEGSDVSISDIAGKAIIINSPNNLVNDIPEIPFYNKKSPHLTTPNIVEKGGFVEYAIDNLNKFGLSIIAKFIATSKHGLSNFADLNEKNVSVGKGWEQYNNKGNDIESDPPPSYENLPPPSDDFNDFVLPTYEESLLGHNSTLVEGY